MIISSHNIRSLLTTMMSIDRHEIDRFGYVMCHDEWIRFRDDPTRVFLKLNDEAQEAVTAAICHRMDVS